MSSRIYLFTITLLISFAIPASALSSQNATDQYGIQANTNKDQTKAIQKYLNAVALAGGGTAELAPGQYTIRGSLTIPTGVTLQGAWSIPHHGILEKGTILRAYANRGTEEGPALIELSQSSGLKGITIVYPEQTLENIQPYPWTIHGQGMHNTIENVTLVNSYNGICIGPETNELHIIRNVFGCVLRRGVKIAGCTDIGRIENVHFNPHYWPRSNHNGVPEDAKPNPDISVAIKMQETLEAFIFERTDWEYVHNTFVFAAKVGYLFTGTDKTDACNGQFHGIGADMCIKAVVFDKIQPIGILVSNGEFVCGKIKQADNVEIDTNAKTVAIHTTKRFTGSAQLSNCNFWGFFTNVMKLEGDGYISLNQSTIMSLVKQRDSLIKVLDGRAHISSVIFKNNEYQKNPETSDKPHVYIAKEAKRAVIAENFAKSGVRIKSEVQDNVVLRDNE